MRERGGELPQDRKEERESETTREREEERERGRGREREREREEEEEVVAFTAVRPYRTKQHDKQTNNGSLGKQFAGKTII